MTTVVADGKLVGLLSDGDLRRLLEKDGASALAKTAGEAMHPDPLTIAAKRVCRGSSASHGRAQDYIVDCGQCCKSDAKA